MRIGILECGRNLPEWTAAHGGFADWFAPFLHPVDPTLEFATFAADQGEMPDSVGECDAWLLTGSPASVNDRLPWQAVLDGFVQEAAGKAPMVGICYGHQHLHDALGGAVARADRWGVGIQNYGITSLPEWLPEDVARASAGGLRLIALHQDEVVSPAPGTHILAANAGCPLGVTMIGEDVLTFQAHPEMRPEQVTLIYDHHRVRIGEEAWRAAQGSLTGPIDDLLAAQWIVAFLRSRLAGPASA